MFPSEATLEGSTLVFRALWQRMIDRRVAAICRYEPRAASGPRLIALMAENEVVDAATGVQLRPSGMHAVILPYADDIRDHAATVEPASIASEWPPPATAEARLLHAPSSSPLTCAADEAAIDAFKGVIGAMTLPYVPWQPPMPNPTLQYLYAGLQTLALNQPRTPFIDSSEPDAEGQVERAGVSWA
jgi:ATP-dependent DNA helicase 2 subunit 1